ncbi:MAG: hypothetical protein QOH43_735 [Solirubrobacteraceae bacterium]|jgi:hypothetical protein|nr:hypothetical protein [Solirubrobacteraceae bacterium]
MADQMTDGALAAQAQLRRAISEAEGRMAAAMEQLVAGKGFSALLGQAAENAVALTSINSQMWDLVLRNFRMVGRSDIHRLGRRLNGIEDKLEMLLQEIEGLDDSRSASGRSG